VLKIDASLARNIDFHVANFKGKRGKPSILKLQSVKIGGRLVSSRVSGFPLASPRLWEKLQNLSLLKVSNQVVMLFRVAFSRVCKRVESRFV